MHNKIAIQFRKFHKSRHRFERLKHCRRCGGFSVLFENHCAACNADNTYIPFTQYAAEVNRRLYHTEVLAGAALFGLCLITARNITEVIVSLVAGIALAVFYFFLRSRYKLDIEEARMHKQLIKHAPDIARGLELDAQMSIQDMQNGNYKDAYEKLREIGVFLVNDPVKMNKVICLNQFFIRKDMELELESVIPSFFSEDFVLYMWEVSKVNRQLIRQSVLDYVQTHRDRIESMEQGKEIMTSIAGAALRMKHYVETYELLILPYVESLPKDRFLRLCKMLAASPDADWRTLYLQCKETTRIRYGFDPDFQGIW